MPHKLGDVSYRFPNEDEWTNLAYLIIPLAATTIVEALLLGFASYVLSIGSWAWHKNENVFSRRLDEMGMMMVLPAICFVLFGSIVGGISGTVAKCACVFFWLFYYENLHHTSSFKHIAGWGTLILVQAIVLSGWWVFAPVGALSIAMWGQFSFPWNEKRYEHGSRHGLIWHTFGAIALFLVLII